MWSGPVFVFFIWQNRRTQLTHDLVCRNMFQIHWRNSFPFPSHLTWSPDHLGSIAPLSEPISSFIRSDASRHHLYSPSTFIPCSLCFSIDLLILVPSGRVSQVWPHLWLRELPGLNNKTLISVWNTFPRFLIQIWLFLPHQLCCGRLPITVQWVRRRVLVHVCLCAFFRSPHCSNDMHTVSLSQCVVMHSHKYLGSPLVITAVTTILTGVHPKDKNIKKKRQDVQTSHSIYQHQKYISL